MKLPLWAETIDGEWISFPHELLRTRKDGRIYITALELILFDEWKEVRNRVNLSKHFNYSPSEDVYYLKEAIT